AMLIIPKIEDEIHSSTQNPTETQIVITSVLDIDANKIICQMYARSVDRDEDIIISGQRHPFLG
ncbi:12297_t:CDS:2, partial [Racocetra fulgida]